MAGFITIRSNDADMPVYLIAPQRQKPGPAILLLFHRDGIDPFTKGIATRLAALDYLVAVPDLYHRSAKLPLRERKAMLRDREIVADVAAVADDLCTRGDVDPERIFVMGHCMGGRVALLAAGRLPRFRGAIVYYGGSVERGWGEGPTPFETLQQIGCPVIGFFGGRDTHPSPEDVDRIDAELSAHGVAHVFHRYPDAGHGFQNPAHDTPQDRAAAEDAWEKTLSFLAVRSRA
jgi:carboxymethylenebutenolidase